MIKKDAWEGPRRIQMVAPAKSINSLSGKYRVLAQLGQGGTADVSLAVARGPKGFSKLVVLKSMRTQFRSEPNFAEMFMVEARLAARLSHPNIVQTNEVFDFDGLPVIGMEYLEGQPLSVASLRP
jgi:serine/threonine-protein kinase